MATFIQYALTQFSSGYKLSQLSDEIKTSDITSSVRAMGIINEELTIAFDNTLSSDDISTMNNIILTHVPIDIPIAIMINQIPITTMQISGTDTTFSNGIVSTMDYDYGAYQNCQGLFVIACMDPGGTSYDLQVYDVTNSLEIATATGLTNSCNIRNNIPISGTLPSSDAIFELRVKVNGTSTVNIKAFAITYC